MGNNIQLWETECSDADDSLSNDLEKDTAWHRMSENIYIHLLIVNTFPGNELFCLVTGISTKMEVEDMCISLHPPLGNAVSSRQTFFPSKMVS